MRAREPEDGCFHGMPVDECPICSDEELAYPSFDFLDLLTESEPEDAVIHSDLTGVPFG